MSKRLKHARNLSCLAVSLIFFSTCVVAESKNIYGVEFHYDSYQRIDGGTVKIAVAGEERLLSPDGADDFLVEKELLNLKLSHDSLEQFIFSALKDNSTKRAYVGFKALSNQPDAAQLLTAVIEKLQKTPNADELLTLISTKFSELSLNVENLIALAVSDTNRRLASTLPFLQQQHDAAVALLQQKVGASLLRRDTAASSKFLVLLAALYGAENESYKQIRSVELSVTNALLPGDSGRLFPLFDMARTAPQLATTLQPLVNELVHEEAAKLLAANNAEKALHILSRLEISRRTPTTHELVYKSLLQIPSNKLEALEDSRVEAMLQALSHVDANIAAQYRSILVNGVRYYLNTGSFSQADLVFHRLREVSPDPSADNDALRVEAALAYLDRDMRSSAEKKLAEIHSGLPLTKRIRLVVAGRYFDFEWLLLLIVAPLAAATLYKKFSKLASPKTATTKPVVSKPLPGGKIVADEPEEELAQFVDVKLRTSLNPKLAEYNKGLSSLGLKPGCTLAEIKNAYRQKVKSIHPDAQKTSEAKASEGFIEITSVYDRVLTLRQEMGLPDE